MSPRVLPRPFAVLTSVVAVLAALALLSTADVACAQESEDAIESEACVRARALFERGTDAVDRGQLAEGRDLLRSAAELCPIVQVWFNLGFALRRSGFTTEAVEVFDALLDGRYGALTPEQEETIRGEAQGARAELATLRLVLSPALAARISLDGRVVGSATADAPYTLSTDAGSHVIGATLDRASGEARVVVTRGERVDVPLTLTEPGEEGIPTWLWVTGGAVVGVALVITIILLALPSPLPQRGPIVET